MSGIGIHQYDVPSSALLSPLLLKKLYAIQILLPLTFLAIKLSLLMLYLSIFRPNLVLRYCIYAGVVINTLFYTACLGAQTVAWTPSSGAPWFATSFSAAHPTPINLGIAQSAFNLASDLYLLVLPLWGVAQLQLSFRKKLGVSAIFLTGALACISSILTLAYRVQLIGDTDSTWDLAVVFTLSIVETTVGIMCSCMPALAAFVRLHTPLFQSVLSLFGDSFRRTFSSARRSASEGTVLSLGGVHESQRELRLKPKTGVQVSEVELGVAMGKSAWEEIV
ncbi:hypothetical protein MMC11_000412 [Xylographa trunciseda]|nr:hypothetical protein [Xylographa trunciseda]